MKRWYALRSKPKKEALACSLLAREDIEVYLPMVASHKFPGRSAEQTPFFPGYFFANLDPERGQIHMARYSLGVVQVVSYGDEPCPVPDELVDLVKERVWQMTRGGWAAGYKQGDKVVITAGPFRGAEALFDRNLSATGRVQVLISLLHRMCRADVHISQLTPARKAAGYSGV